MTEGIVIALIGLFGSAIGSLVGILVNSKLMSYRLEQLEKKVEKHNNLVERTYSLETKEEVLEQRIDALHEYIDTLRKE